MPRVVITGTDTGIGKTVLAAALVEALGAAYYKPVQSGLDAESDSAVVARLAPNGRDRIIPESYRLQSPLSPHRAAEIDGITIDPARLDPDAIAGPLVVEAAGGIMAPVTRRLTFLDLFARWQLPVVLCARTTLGTINHSLLALTALRMRAVPTLGVAFIGDSNEDNEATIAAMGRVRRLGRLPLLDPLTPQNLHETFARHFDVETFRRASAILTP